MKDDRYFKLMSDDSLELTEEEVKEGWHFCGDMDGLLANYNEPDGDCYCYLNTKRRYRR